MRIVTARLNHETNTFSPLATPIAAFRPLWGDAAREAGTASATALGVFLAFAQARGAETAVPVMAHANPSGPVADAAFETLTAAILAAVSEGCEAILLDLHGAMVTESHDDGEGEPPRPDSRNRTRCAPRRRPRSSRQRHRSDGRGG
ncbi:M81 family metallopeptidase [Methylobacterium sp. P31]